MSVTQKELFQMMLDNSNNGQLQICRVDSSASILTDICGDHKGNMFALPFRSDEVVLDVSIKMKREVFLQINELLSRVMR
jgi:hypothetical protein